MIRTRGAVEGVSKERHSGEPAKEPPVILKKKSVKQACVDIEPRSPLFIFVNKA